jgi:hypothetical protein
MTPCPKPLPRVIEKTIKAREAETHRKEIKAAVWKRDQGRCRVCGETATEMHELRFRSLGGERSPVNSVAVCTFNAHNCHRLLQTHAIHVEGSDANKRLVFTWNRDRVPVGKEPFRILSKRRSQREIGR